MPVTRNVASQRLLLQLRRPRVGQDLVSLPGPSQLRSQRVGAHSFKNFVGFCFLAFKLLTVMFSAAQVSGTEERHHPADPVQSAGHCRLPNSESSVELARASYKAIAHAGSLHADVSRWPIVDNCIPITVNNPDGI